jgi:signal transduction histidine kinase
VLPSDRAEGDPGTPGGSLRSELLARLAVLAAAALFLGIGIASVLQLAGLNSNLTVGLLLLLVLLDVIVFLALGSHLMERLVLRPLEETVAVAEAIARGEYDRRVPAGRTREAATLSRALNGLTDQLLQNQARLAENVRSLDETNRLLNETQRELIQAEKMASIGRLGAGIAHEIGNPLGALLGYVAVLRRRGLAEDLVPGMEREAGRIDQIVRGLLDYARPGPATREPVEVNESIRRATELLRAQGRLGGVSVRLSLAEELPPVPGVPHRVEQIFVNLLSNADAAMGGEGEITVVTRRERYTPERPVPARRADDPPGIDYSHLRRLRYGTFRDTNRLQSEREVVRVVVADTGPGIPPDQIEAVFDPFFTTKAPGEGTGLGLAIVAGTVAEMGGRIEVSSAPGGGATFNLYFPIGEP